MDRRRAFAALALALAGAAALPVPPLREMRWIDPALPRAEIARLATTQPVECLTVPADPATRAQVAIGRALFRTPLLLGGQAARAGVACASCHRNGRGNPHFAFPGVSGAAGTADVTSSLFSSKRGDGVVNPKPIPDLGVDTPKISRDPASPALRAFIRGLIVEEFDGLDPPAAALDGLTAYVRALGPGGCDADAVEPRNATSDGRELRTAAAEVRETLAAIDAATTAPDAATARLLIAAARSSLGRLDERFAGNADVRQRLAARDAALLRIQQRLVGDARRTAALQRWRVDFGRDAGALGRAEPRSLYALAAWR